MQCEDARNFLQDLTEGNLSEAARNTVERHVGDCTVCVGDLKALGYVDEQLKNQPMLPTPPGLVDRVMAHVFPVQKTSFKREMFRFAAAAVFLMAVTIGVLSLDIRSLMGERAANFVDQGVTTPFDVRHD